MKLKKIIPLLLVTSFAFTGCSKRDDPKLKHEYVYYNDGKEEKVKKETIDASTKNNVTVSILPNEWMEYYDSISDYRSIRYYYRAGTENTKPVSPSLSWSITQDANEYGIAISTNKDMSNSTYISAENNKTVELKDLFAGTHYYYQVHAKYDGREVVSKRFDFSTTDFIRTLDIDKVLNARDLGNKKTENKKKRVKDGLVFRSANLDSVTATGRKDAIEKYGIKTDLDLREAGQKDNPLGEPVHYINNASALYGSPAYYSMDNGVNCVEYQPAMLNNLKVFANMDNLPVIFHCAVGRDRTGTLAVTLYLLLGIDLDQIRQDYVVSFFSSACNGASLETYCESMEALIDYYSYYKSKDGTNTGTVYERAERYALDIGLTKDEINSIRNNLLEDVKK